MKKIRWGILGTGRIARKLAEALALEPDSEMVAVGSRTQAAADAFGKDMHIPHRHGSYSALAEDPDVDVVYVATPHPLHRSNTLDCLRAGKAVLCEKPFALNAPQAQEMVSLAREKRLFLMEAMWTRFLPVLVKVRELLAAGALGEVRLVIADFGFKAAWDPKSRLFDPALGGGSLLDLGVYPISLASMVFGGLPERIVSSALLGSTGVDEQAAAILEYSLGRQAVVACSFRFDSPQEAHLIGAEGRIHIQQPWWNPKAFTLSRSGQKELVFSLPYQGNGYVHEATEVVDCLRSGRLESDVMPLEETLRIMQTMDTMRAQWGLEYPGEE